MSGDKTENTVSIDSVDRDDTKTFEESKSTESSSGKVTKKRKILSPREHKEICDFVTNFKGLTIECEMQMIYVRYTDIERQTLKSILQTELGQRSRSQHWRQESLGKKYLKAFEEKSDNNWNTKVLTNIAAAENISPVALCRAILQEKYHFTNKSQITRFLKNPNLIDDVKLAANVMQCLCCDSQEGPLVDLRRRVLGEEYEFLLKELASAAGMHFYDENDLRRLGYDKTPDIKLILPFLYKQHVVNWIESKACFGDPKTHKWYIQQQLNSYTNRFGPGIVIYWFGYRTDTPESPDNSGIIVLDDFPKSEDMEFLQLDETETADASISAICQSLDKQKLETTKAADTEVQN